MATTKTKTTATTATATNSSSTAARRTLILQQFFSSPRNSPWIGLVIRLGLAVVLPALMDHAATKVPYTDIDFYVFTDAASYVEQGMSPFTRHTYRYTPYLAWFISKTCLPVHVELTRYVFCVADAVCGYIILQIRQRQRQQRQQQRHEDQKSVQRQQQQQHHHDNDSSSSSLTSPSFIDACWWLYNPLAINICTRGSSESLMVLLPVLAAYWCATGAAATTIRRRSRSGSTTSSSTMGPVRRTAVVTGLLHGWSIHSKLYPIIYTGSYMTYFATVAASATTDTVTDTARGEMTSTKTTTTTTKFPWFEPFRLLRLIRLWITRFFFTPPFLPLVFLMSTIASFGVSTYMAVYWFGDETLDESLLYHFGRVDHRHNYSMYWYWIYLERARSSDAAELGTVDDFESSTTTTTNLLSLSNLGKILLIPQAVLLVYSSLGLVAAGGGGGGASGTGGSNRQRHEASSPSPQRLALALFVQTYLFVTHNKVITAQYFTWYLCLLPLCCYTNDNDDSNDGQDNNSKNNMIKKKKVRRMIISLVFLLCSILFWLLSAYCLEMQGMAVHRVNWIASVCYFAANVNVLGSFLSFFEVQPIATR